MKIIDVLIIDTQIFRRTLSEAEVPELHESVQKCLFDQADKWFHIVKYF